MKIIKSIVKATMDLMRALGARSTYRIRISYFTAISYLLTSNGNLCHFLTVLMAIISHSCCNFDKNII